MHIVFQHRCQLPVLKYGGTERFLFWLMKALIRANIKVSFIGLPGSQLESLGIQFIPNRPGEDFRPLIPKDAHLFHCFTNPEYPIDMPYLVTIEGNGQPGESFVENTVFVSKNHAQRHGGNYFIHNGIDLEEYPFTPKPFDPRQFLFLAKGSWKVKNLKHCIESCKLTKSFLHIVGGRSYLPSRYLYNYGMLGGSRKLTAINKASTLLFPVRWHEPFGIAIIEAMALGLAVIGSPYGSLPELITPEVGHIVSNFSELKEKMETIGDHPFQPEQIRAYVEKFFAIDKIAQQYIQLYDKIIAGEKLHPHRPRVKSERSPTELLDF